MAELPKLKKIRAGHRAHVTKLIGEATDSKKLTLDQNLILLARIEKKADVLEKCDSDVLGVMAETDDIDAEIEESSGYMDRLIEAKTMLELNISHLNKKVTEERQKMVDEKIPSQKVESSAGKKGENQVRLPKILIKEYDGSILAWRSFWEQFDQSVDKRDDLSDVQKFTYLQSYLVGEAERAIRGFSLSAENYKVAIETLKSRFGNNQARIAAHMKDLRGLSAVKNISDVASMRSMYDSLEFNISNLKELKVDVSTYGSLLIAIIFDRIPEELRIKISEKFGDNEWKLDEMLTVLKTQIEARERSIAIGSFTPSECLLDTQYTSQAMQIRASEEESRRTDYFDRGVYNKKNQVSRNDLINCAFCNSNGHVSSKCRNVTDINVRYDIARKERLCFVCLKKFHRSDECPYDYNCIKCQRRHNVALCTQFNGGENVFSRGRGRGNNSQFIGGDNNVSFRGRGRGNNSTRGFPNSRQTNFNNLAQANPHEVFEDYYDGSRGHPDFRRSYYNNNNLADTEQSNEHKIEQNGRPSNVFCGVEKGNNVLLQCAMANVVNNGLSASTCVLFDSGSQRSYINSKLKTKLNLKYLRTEKLILRTFSSNEDKLQNLDVYQVCVEGRNGVHIFLEALCVPYICANLCPPSNSWVKEKFTHLRDLELAEPPTNKNSVDMLIGLDYLYSFCSGKHRRGFSAGGPVGVESVLGWLVCGPVEFKKQHGTDVFTNLIKINDEKVENESDSDLKVVLKEFWSTQEVSNDDMDINDIVLQRFDETIYFNGVRYVAGLPLKSTEEFIPDNFSMADRRFNNMASTKLDIDQELKQEYISVFKSYLEEGMIERVNNFGTPGRVHYLPHHPVVRAEKETTKVRPVFDASSKEKGSKSLNDCLYPGPSLLGKIYDIVIRLCFKKIILIADIRQAFLNIEIHEDDRDLLRFIFFDLDDKENVSKCSYRFKRGCFGVTSLPFMMCATIKYHMNWLKLYYPDLCLKIEQFLRDLYMDDVATSVDNVNEGIDFYNFANDAMGSAGFELRKWFSNNPEVRKYMGCNENEGQKSRKILGMMLNNDDEFVYNLEEMVEYAEKLPLTKRSILRFGAKFFDLPGFISPVVIIAKIYFQKVCLDNSNWDKELHGDIKEGWLHYLAELRRINCIRVPRYLFSTVVGNLKQISVHGFCDSSEQAYCATVYVCTAASDGYASRLVSSKTKVAPIKEHSIPRLELLSCLLLVELMQSFCTAVSSIVDIEDKYFWSDSEVALSWIRGENKMRKPWVQNRVTKIRKLSDINRWNHIPSEINPADIATREEAALKFVSNDLWWFGPPFLKNKIEIPNFCIQTSGIVEVEPVSVMVVAPVLNYGIGNVVNMERYSSLMKLLRITAYILRFVLKKKGISEEVSAEEIEDAMNRWIKYEQKLMIADEQHLNKCRQLNLFSDGEGLLRLKGRLENSHLLYDEKHPVFLNYRSYFSRLLILDSHEKVKHMRTKATLNELRSRFYISRGRVTVRSVIKGCYECNRVIKKPIIGPPPPDLPEYRVTYEFAFTNVGIDHAGPLYVKEIYSSNSLLHKAWVCLFTCAATRGVHIELCPTLDTSGLIRCLKRFIGRRGKFKLAVSDNFKSFISKELEQFLTKEGIKWDNILPKAPWWGAFYERLIRIIKEALKKCIGKARLTYEELETVLVEIEAVINSRPLTYLYEDSQEEALTPSHLVVGRRLLNGKPEISNVVEQSSEKLTNRFTYLQAIIDHYWKRFSKEYLLELHQHHLEVCKRNYDMFCKLVLGDVVLIKDDKTKRNEWKKGKVVKLLEGNDGNVRGAMLKVCNRGVVSYLLRPIQKIIPLEVQREVKDDDVNTCNYDQREDKDDDVLLDDTSSVNNNVEEQNFAPVHSSTSGLRRSSRIAKNNNFPSS